MEDEKGEVKEKLVFVGVVIVEALTMAAGSLAGAYQGLFGTCLSKLLLPLPEQP